jgi:regulator of sigma E protease
MLEQVYGLFGGGLTMIAAFVFVLTIVIFVHELGHFLVARWCGVTVKAFSIGFGKEIFAWTDRKGTRWRVAWLPLGGYVKFQDDDNGASMPSEAAIRAMTPEEREGSFHLKPVWKRAAVVAAGPIANFLLAIAIFAAMFMIIGVTTMEPRIAKVLADSPAATAGFKDNDLVVSIDGRAIDDFADLQHIVSSSPGRRLAVVVDRGGALHTLHVTPTLREHDDRIAGKHSRAVIGIQGSGQVSKVTHGRVGPVEAVRLGVERTWTIGEGTLAYIWNVVRRQQSADQLGGPIRIAEVAGKTAQLGPEYLIGLVALLSVSIGLLNLFPIPVLDGGHLMFYAIEAIRGKPLGPRAQEMGFRVGLALIGMLFVFTTWNDIMRNIRNFTGLG